MPKTELMDSSKQAMVLLLGIMFFLSLLTVFMVNISDSSPEENFNGSTSDAASNSSEAGEGNETGVVDTEKPISEMNVLEQAIYGLVNLWSDFETGTEALANMTREDD